MTGSLAGTDGHSAADCLPSMDPGRPGYALGGLCLHALLLLPLICSSPTESPGLSSASDSQGSIPVPDEQRLLNRVFRAHRYDNSIRPVYNATTSVKVKFGMTLIQIMDMVSMKRCNSNQRKKHNNNSICISCVCEAIIYYRPVDI